MWNQDKNKLKTSWNRESFISPMVTRIKSFLILQIIAMYILVRSKLKFYKDFH
jgi:hypothetical protein